jgi:hypothetical protein
MAVLSCVPNTGDSISSSMAQRTVLAHKYGTENSIISCNWYNKRQYLPSYLTEGTALAHVPTSVYITVLANVPGSE